MRVIGITGSSGAGKSTVSEIIKENYHSYIINADKIARQISEKGTPYYKAIVKYFGKEILLDDNQINRKKLAHIIYTQDEKREQLNKYTFYYITSEIKKEIMKNSDYDFVIIDAPLLFESKLNLICESVIVVIANQIEQINRICIRDLITVEQAKQRLRAQKENKFYIDRATHVIVNNGKIQDIEAEVKKVMNRLINEI